MGPRWTDERDRYREALERLVTALALTSTPVTPALVTPLLHAKAVLAGKLSRPATDSEAFASGAESASPQSTEAGPVATTGRASLSEGAREELITLSRLTDRTTAYRLALGRIADVLRWRLFVDGDEVSGRIDRREVVTIMLQYILDVSDANDGALRSLREIAPLFAAQWLASSTDIAFTTADVAQHAAELLAAHGEGRASAVCGECLGKGIHECGDSTCGAEGADCTACNGRGRASLSDAEAVAEANAVADGGCDAQMPDAEQPDRPWSCTRPRGHIGEHIAVDSIEVCARWPNGEGR